MKTCGPYKIISTLGEGTFGDVKLAEHKETKQKVALKIIKKESDLPTMDYDFKSEVAIMKQLKHLNLLKLIEYDENADLVFKNGTSFKSKYIALELAKHGVIFDIIVDSGKFDENLARYYFHQLVDALEHMHQNGYVHRDIKLENILIDEKFDLKLTDFGFSDKEEVSDNPKGSSLYMAPEMHKLEKFETKPADIFALGVCLFMMVKAHQPFVQATRTDEYYRVFMTDPKSFWKFHFKKGKKYGHSKSLIKLLNKLFKTDPKSRITLADLKENEWFNGPVPTKEEVQEEMAARL